MVFLWLFLSAKIQIKAELEAKFGLFFFFAGPFPSVTTKVIVYNILIIRCNNGVVLNTHVFKPIA